MVELIGRDSVADFIAKSGKKKFNIYVAGQESKRMPAWSCVSGNVVDSFNAWADMAASSGANTIEYTIILFNKIEKNTTDANEDTDGSKVRTTFCLMQIPPRQPGQYQTVPYPYNHQYQLPPQQGDDKLNAILAAINGRGNQPQVDVNAAINAAVEKVAHQYQIKALTEGNERILQQMAKQMADMRNHYEELLEEEEEEEENERRIQEKQDNAKAKKEEMEFYGKLLNGVMQQGKEIFYAYNPDKLRALNAAQGRSVAVNGPRISSNTAKESGWQVPVSDKVGELPVVTDAERDTGKTPNPEDQKAKIAMYAGKLWDEADDEFGDDLILLYKMFKDMPAKYQEMTLELRKTMRGE